MLLISIKPYFSNHTHTFMDYHELFYTWRSYFMKYDDFVCISMNLVITKTIFSFFYIYISNWTFSHIVFHGVKDVSVIFMLLVLVGLFCCTWNLVAILIIMSWPFIRFINQIYKEVLYLGWINILHYHNIVRSIVCNF